MSAQRGSIGAQHARFAGVRGAVLLVLLGLAVYGPGLFSIPPVDRDESRFAQASRQMLESVALPPAERDPRLHAGGLVVPNVAARPRLNKPPLIYWAQAAAAWLCTAGDPARDAIWMYRLPSVASALIAALATWRLARTMLGERPAWLAGALLAVCPIVVWDAHQARADQLLLACTTAAMLALWRVWSARRDAPPAQWAWPILFWAALGAGVMTKGPITPMIAALTTLALCLARRDWRWLARLKPIVGLVILAAIVAPWVVAVGQRVGWHEYTSIILDETLGRTAGAKEGHWGPPGYHAVLSAVLFWPGSLLTLAAIVRATRAAGLLAPVLPGAPKRSLTARWRARDRVQSPDADGALFLLAWLIPAWLVFELVSTKLPHYTMPLYPALAILTARAIDGIVRAAPDAVALARERLGFAVWCLIALAWLGAFPIALGVLVGSPASLAIGIAAGAAGLAALALGSARAFARGRPLPLHAWAIGAWALVVAVSLGVLLPRARPLWVSAAIARAIPADASAIGAVGFHEDSLVFLTRGRLERLPDDAGPGWLAAHPGAVLIAPADLDLPGARELAEVEGFNYSTGRRVRLRIVRP